MGGNHCTFVVPRVVSASKSQVKQPISCFRAHISRARDSIIQSQPANKALLHDIAVLSGSEPPVADSQLAQSRRRKERHLRTNKTKRPSHTSAPPTLSILGWQDEKYKTEIKAVHCSAIKVFNPLYRKLIDHGDETDAI